jgi:hypothetical protein
MAPIALSHGDGAPGAGAEDCITRARRLWRAELGSSPRPTRCCASSAPLFCADSGALSVGWISCCPGFQVCQCHGRAQSRPRVPPSHLAVTVTVTRSRCTCLGFGNPIANPIANLHRELQEKIPRPSTSPAARRARPRPLVPRNLLGGARVGRCHRLLEELALAFAMGTFTGGKSQYGWSILERITRGFQQRVRRKQQLRLKTAYDQHDCNFKHHKTLAPPRPCPRSAHPYT